MGLLRRPARPAPSETVRTALAGAGREHPVAWAVDDASGATVAAGRTHLTVVSAGGEVLLDRPWHLVDNGRWDHDDRRLTVTFVDPTPAARFRLTAGETPLLEALRERVQASVVLADTVDLGSRRSARVVVRRDMATGALLGQTILGRGVRRTDPGVAEQTSAALARLKEQVGL